MGSSSSRPLPGAHPDQWTARDVKHFLKAEEWQGKLLKYKEHLQGTNGQNLFAMDERALVKAARGPCPDLIEAINKIKGTWGMIPAPSGSTPSAPAPVANAGVPAEPTPWAAVDAGGQHWTPEDVGSPPLASEPEAMPVFAEAAMKSRQVIEKLAACIPGGGDTDIIARLLGPVTGKGLVEAVDVSSELAHLLLIAHKIQGAADTSLANRENCSKMACLASEVLRLIDVAAKRGGMAALPPAAVLEDISIKCEEGLRQVEVFSQPGWLMHMCCNENLKDEFDAVHNSIVEVVKADGLDGNRTLMPGSYRDVTRGVRRLVKQIGNGHITAGLVKLKGDVLADQAKDLAALLETPMAALYAEVELLPASLGELTAEAVYANMVNEAGGNVASLTLRLFQWYDKNHSEALEPEELRQMLQDLGMLDGKKAAEADAYVANVMKVADRDCDGRLNLDEFAAYYSTVSTSRARQQLRATMGMEAEEDLRQVFRSFIAFGNRQTSSQTGGHEATANEVLTMDTAQYAKFCRDCGVVTATQKAGCVTQIEADIIFASVKAKGQRRITFEEFLTCVQQCAEKKNMSFESLLRQIIAKGGPMTRGTLPQNVRLHDDKSTYTGVYAKGGPTNVDGVRDLATLVDRNDKRPVSATPNKGQPGAGGRDSQHKTPPSATRQSQTLSAARRASLAGPTGLPSLKSQFETFSSFGNPSGKGDMNMDGARFVKLCRDCGLLDKAFSTTNADLLFAKVKTKGTNRITYTEFREALASLATQKGMQLQDVITQITSSQPMVTRG